MNDFGDLFFSNASCLITLEKIKTSFQKK